ncbi:MAG: hypothetical protein GF347_00525 [Candidatus Moranbacteria bacterium]|nr:hypothetical protein [Candidatus Moranbacteria bacterium]
MSNSFEKTAPNFDPIIFNPFKQSKSRYERGHPRTIGIYRKYLKNNPKIMEMQTGQAIISKEPIIAFNLNPSYLISRNNRGQFALINIIGIAPNIYIPFLKKNLQNEKNEKLPSYLINNLIKCKLESRLKKYQQIIELKGLEYFNPKAQIDIILDPSLKKLCIISNNHLIEKNLDSILT